MEQMNRIELRGNVGTASLNAVGDTQVLRFTLATNYVYKDKEGNAVIETTWHNVSAWEGRGMPDLGRIEKGACVHVIGRLKNNKYTNADGVEKQFWEVQAQQLEIEEEPCKSQVNF